jgi:hypothetical protein
MYLPLHPLFDIRLTQSAALCHPTVNKDTLLSSCYLSEALRYWRRHRRRFKVNQISPLNNLLLDAR